MSDLRQWAARLESEIARELGQTVSVAPGGSPPETGASFEDVLEIPEGELVLATASEDVQKLLVEARVIDDSPMSQADLHELWSGILGSVAARLGGRAEAVSSPGPLPPDPFTLRLGAATVRMALALRSAPAKPARAEAPIRQQTGNFDLLLEVELEAAVRFGSRELELRELLQLGPGDVVELDRNLADPVDLIVGDKIVARGEVVLVNGNFGLRVTEVAEPMRRLESIRWLS